MIRNARIMEPALDQTGVRVAMAGEVMIAPNVGLMKIPNSVVVVVVVVFQSAVYLHTFVLQLYVTRLVCTGCAHRLTTAIAPAATREMPVTPVCFRMYNIIMYIHYAHVYVLYICMYVW